MIGQWVFVGPGTLGWVLVMAGLWLLVKVLFALGPWFGPATVTALSIWPLYVYGRTRRPESFVGLCLLLAWAAYAWLNYLLPDGLPFSFFFVFIALGFLAVYGLATRPNPWPLLPATLLLGIGTISWVVGMGIAHARYVVPALVLLWGMWLLLRYTRNGA